MSSPQLPGWLSGPPKFLCRGYSLNFLFTLILFIPLNENGARGAIVVKALRYKPAGRVFDSCWCHWNFSVT